MGTLTVRKLLVGDIILTSTFQKLRPMLIVAIVDGQCFGIPLSTNKTGLLMQDKALTNCRFLDPEKPTYFYPMIHRVGGDWAKSKWIGHINPASVKKIKQQVLDKLKNHVLNNE